MKGADRDEKKKGVPLYRGNVDDGEKTVLFERTGKEMISLSPDRVCRSIVIKGERFPNGKSEQICSHGVPGIKETICKLALGVTHTEPPIPFGRQTQARSYRL